MDGSGLSVLIRAALKEHTSFCDSLAHIARRVMEKAQEQQLVKVAVACRWGKHRSVGFAMELQEELSLRQLDSCVVHLERSRWDPEVRRQLRLPANQGLPWPCEVNGVVFEWKNGRLPQHLRVR